MKKILSALLLCILNASALAQSTLLQGGPTTPGHAPMYVGQGSGQAVVQDSGPASGGAIGLGLSELLLTARGTGSAPHVGQGTGPLGTNFCGYDGPITNATGYHYLCFSANAQGGGLITYGAGGGASALPLNININGINYNLANIIPANNNSAVWQSTGPATQGQLWRLGAVSTCTSANGAAGGSFYGQMNTAAGADFSTYLPWTYWCKNYATSYNSGTFWNPATGIGVGVPLNDDTATNWYASQTTIISTNLLSNSRPVFSVTLGSGGTAGKVTAVTLGSSGAGYLASQTAIQGVLYRTDNGFSVTVWGCADGGGNITAASFHPNADCSGGNAFPTASSAFGADVSKIVFVVQGTAPVGGKIVLDGDPILTMFRDPSPYTAANGSVVGQFNWSATKLDDGLVATMGGVLTFVGSDDHTNPIAQNCILSAAPTTQASSGFFCRLWVLKGLVSADNLNLPAVDYGQSTTNWKEYHLNTGVNGEADIGYLKYVATEVDFYTSGATPIVFGTNGSEAFRIQTNQRIDSLAMFRFQGAATQPATGTGLEISFGGGGAVLSSINRTSGVYQPVSFVGLPYQLNTSGSNGLYFDAAALRPVEAASVVTLGDATHPFANVYMKAGSALVLGTASFTYAGSVAFSGAFGTTFTITAATAPTLPSGTHTLAAIDLIQTWTAIQNFTTATFSGAAEIGVTNLVLTAGALGLGKLTNTGSASAPGAGGAKVEAICGTNAGTAKLIAYAGTSATPVTILDNIGAGVTGC